MNEQIKITDRNKPFCVISVGVFGEYSIHDIQINSSWSSNPYGESYAEVPDDMVQDILATRGYCDITVKRGVVTEFIAKEIPEIPEVEPAPSQLDVIEAQVTYTAMMTDTLLEV